MTEPPRRRFARLRRWTWRILLAVVVLRVLLALFLPQVLGLAARFVGLSLEVNDASLSISGLSFRAEDMIVRVRNVPDAPPLLVAHDVVLDVATLQLFRGDIVIVDAAMAGARIAVKRDATGKFLLPEAWLQPAPVSEPPPPPKEPQPIRFELPAKVLSARLHDLQLSFVDESVQPPLNLHANVDVDTAALGESDKPATVLVQIDSASHYDSASFEANITATGDRLELTWKAALRGLRPAALPVKLDVPPELIGKRIDVDANGAVKGATREDSPYLPELSAAAEVEALLGDRKASFTFRAGPVAGTQGSHALPFELALAADGIVDAVRVDGGEVVLAPALSARGNVTVEHLTLQAVATKLAELGITLPEGGLGVRAAFDAELGDGLSASVSNVAVEGGGERVVLPRAAVHDVRPAGGGVAIGGVDIQGPVVAAKRAADGTFGVLGIRVDPKALAGGTPPAGPAGAHGTPAVAPPPPPPPAAVKEPFVLPHVRLGSLAWSAAKFTFVDEKMEPPATLAIDGVDVRGSGITIGKEAPPAKLTASARIVDSIESVRVDATLKSGAKTCAIEAETTAEGITAAGAAPWLKQLGIEPVLRSGTLRVRTAASLTTGADGIEIGARVADLRFADGDDVLVSVRNVAGSEVRIGETLDLGTWRVDEPYLSVRRVDDTVQVLGLRVIPVPPSKEDAPTRRRPVLHAATKVAGPATKLPTLPRLQFVLDRAVLAVAKGDQPPTTIGVDAKIDAPRGSPIAFDATLRVDGAVPDAKCSGRVTPSDDGVKLDLSFDASKMRGEGLATLLPPNVRCTLQNAEVHARLVAALNVAPQLGVSLHVDEVRVTDGGAELFALDHFGVDVPELDLERVRIAKLDGHGLRTQVTLTDDGVLVPGFLVMPPAPGTVRPAPPPAPRVAREPMQLPMIAIDELSFVCDRIEIRERRATDGEPLVLTGRVTMEPWAPQLGEGAPAPAKLTFTSSAAPLCGELRADVEVNVFERAPTIDMVVKGTAIDLTAIQRVLPSLAETVQGRTSNAELAANVHMRVNLMRRDARSFAPGQPFGVSVVVENAALRDVATGEALVSVSTLDVDVRSIDPATGDVGVRGIEIDEPTLAITRTADGIDLLGLRVIVPMLTVPPREPKAPAASAAAPKAAPPKPAPSKPVARPGRAPVFTLDRLSVEGMSFVIADATTTPPTQMPFDEIEAQIVGFSTRGFTEPRPFGFAVTVRGGDITLPRRIEHSSLITGVLGSAARAVTLHGDQSQPEQRPLFDEVAITGQMQLHPFLRGDLRLRVTDFELQSLRGLASQNGVDIGDGVVNQTLTIDLRGPEGADVRSNTVMTHLSLSEEAGGPISTYLRLPMSLDAVLFLLKNNAGEHRLPVRAHVDAENVGGSGIAEALIEALTQMIADAVAGAPGRTASALVSGLSLGLFGGGKAEPVTATVTFGTGDSLPAGGDLRPIVDALADNGVVELVHELGKGDFDRAAQLATPPPEVLAVTLDRLRARRREHGDTYVSLATEVSGLFGAGRMQEAHRKQEELASLGDRIGELEHTIDSALAMLVGDNDRARKRRTQAAAQGIGRSRLAYLADELKRLVPGLTDDRIRLRTPRGIPTSDPEGGKVIVTVRPGTGP